MDDELFFGSLGSSSSNLSSIFGVAPSESKPSASLRYSPPKNPRQAREVETDDDGQRGSAASAWDVRIAVVVSAFKTINKENVSQGRLGFALLQNGSAFKIILYKTKTDVQSTLTLSETAKLYLKNSYLQFADDSQCFWSVLTDVKDRETVLEWIKKSGVVLEEEKPEIKEEKAAILSRITKMGQALPQMATTSTTTDVSDSSDTEVVKKPLVPVRKPRVTQVVAVPTEHSFQQDAPLVSMLLTENRTQNCEIRMNLSKLETKIERVLDKLDSQRNGRGQRDVEDEILLLEEKILELKKENRKLRKFSPPEVGDLDLSEVKSTEELAKRLLHEIQKEKENVSALQQSLKEKEADLADKTMLLADTQAEIAVLKSQTAPNDVDSVVKDIMTKLYASICENFNSQTSYTAGEVLAITGGVIKDETKKVLKELKLKN